MINELKFKEVVNADYNVGEINYIDNS